MKYFCLILVLFAMSFQCANAQLSGSGTSLSPYIINDIDDFDLFCDNDGSVDYWAQGVYVELADDIDLSTKTYRNSAVVNGEEILDLINDGFAGTPYSGNFNGSGFTISGISFDAQYNLELYLGIFGSVSDTGSVINLNVSDVTINSSVSWKYFGGIAALNYGNIENCSLNSSIIISDVVTYFGGIAAKNYGRIDKCISDSVFLITSGSYVGGITAESSGDITMSCFNGQINCIDYAGGIVARCLGGEVTDCYSLGTIGGQVYIGGIAGESYSLEMQRCYSYLNISGVLAGELAGNAAFSLTDCYYVDSDYASSSYGIEISEPNLAVADSFVNWDFSANDGSPAVWVISAGGYPQLSWQVETVVVPGVVGMTLQQAQNELLAQGLILGSVEYFTSHTIDTDSVVSQQPLALELLPAGSQVSLMVCSGAPYAGGSGAAEDPYLISEPEHLLDINNHVEDFSSYFKLVNNISLNGLVVETNIIGKPQNNIYFNGTFDGDGFEISDFEIISGGGDSENIGFFSCLSDDGEVINLNIKSCAVNGGSESNSVAILSGENNGMISFCSCRGIVKGYSNCGAIAGRNEGEIVHSSADINLEIIFAEGAGQLAGGICGINNGIVDYSYCYGSILVSPKCKYAGGICGQNISSVQKSFFNGKLISQGQNDYIGGAFGVNYGLAADCYIQGMIEIDGICDNVSLFCGGNTGFLTAGYCAVELKYIENLVQIGSFCLGNTGLIESCYSLRSDGTETANCIVYDKLDMVDKNNYNGFDFVNTWQGGMGDFPVLRVAKSSDIDCDGTTNLTDLAIIAENWLSD